MAIDTLTLRYPPQIMCITDVILSKMNVLSLLCTSKKYVTAPIKNIRVITYMKRKSTRKIQNLVKNGRKKNTINILAVKHIFQIKSHQEISKFLKMSEKEKITC